MKMNTARRADALRDEIIQTRADLGETMEALAAKADIPARARASASRTADRVRGRMAERGGGRDTTVPWMILAAGAAAAIVLAVVARGRRP